MNIFHLPLKKINCNRLNRILGYYASPYYHYTIIIVFVIYIPWIFHDTIIYTPQQLTDVTIRNKSDTKPGQAICHVAEEENAIMVVMGTRGMGKIRRTLMGSVSDYVVHHAKMPVVVCRHAEETSGDFTE